MGPGFESQVPQRICVFFLQGITCTLQSVGPPYSSYHQAPGGLRSNQMARDEGLSYVLVNKRILDEKSQNKAWMYWASELPDSPPSLGPNPLSLFLFLFSFIIFLFLFIVLLLLFLIN